MMRNETVIVTGASAGLGRAIVRSFAKRGANIGLLARGHDGLEGAKRDVEDLGGRAIILPCDVSDPDGVEEAAKKTEEVFGPIDVWVNNAMTSVFSEFRHMTPEEFRRVTEVAYLGYVYGTMSALKRMLSRDTGTIIQVGSALAYRSIPLQAAYCGAKHGIVGFTDSIRSELIRQKSRVHITTVHMPAMNTPQFRWVKSRLPHKAQPVPPIYQPEVGAEAVYWAAHQRRRDVYVTMATAKAIWGTKIIPGLLDRYLAKKAYTGQQYDGPDDPNRPNNLWNPLPGDHGPHGGFGDRSRDWSWEMVLVRNKYRLLAAVAAGAVGVLLVRRKLLAR